MNQVYDDDDDVDKITAPAGQQLIDRSEEVAKKFTQSYRKLS
jgi:hypothetical protein